MKKLFLMLASLAFALAAGAKEVKVTVAISPVSFAEDSYVKVEGESEDITVVINDTECVFDGTTGKVKSGTPSDLNKRSVPASVRIPKSPITLADTKYVVTDKGGNSIESSLSLSCDGVDINADVAVKTVAQLKALYDDDGSQMVVHLEDGLTCMEDDESLVSGWKHYVYLYDKSTNIVKKVADYETGY